MNKKEPIGWDSAFGFFFLPSSTGASAEQSVTDSKYGKLCSHDQVESCQPGGISGDDDADACEGGSGGSAKQYQFFPADALQIVHADLVGDPGKLQQEDKSQQPLRLLYDMIVCHDQLQQHPVKHTAKNTEQTDHKRRQQQSAFQIASDCVHIPGRAALQRKGLRGCRVSVHREPDGTAGCVEQIVHRHLFRAKPCDDS